MDETTTEAEQLHRSARTFRWTLRISEDAFFFAKVEGDVGRVYPGLTKSDFRRDPSAFAKFFSADSIEEMGDFVNGVFNGGVEKGAVGTWHSLPEYDIIIEIELYDVVRYQDAAGKPLCIETGETRLVTESMRTYGAIVSKIISEHRETADHRLGNKLRLMHLLCQEERLEELNRSFERIGHEIAIRRKFFDDVPRIEPVAAAAFIAEEFTQTDVDIEGCPGRPESTGVLFYTLSGAPVSPIVLQVLVLQDCASNVFKHGTGKARVRFSDRGFAIANPVPGSAPQGLGARRPSVPSRRLGLETLRHVASELDISVTIDQAETGWFEVSVGFGAVKFVDLSSTRPTDADVPGSNPPTTAVTVADLSWIVVDDEPLIGRRFEAIAKKQFPGTDVAVVSSPADVANLVKALALVVKGFAKPKHGRTSKATVVIYDEQLRELDDALDLVAVTGTELRDRVAACPLLADALAAKTLFSVSASASIVDDPRVLLRLGKTGSVAADMRAVAAAVAAELERSRSSLRRSSAARHQPREAAAASGPASLRTAE